MKAAVAIALKDLRLLARDKASFFWMLGFPLLFGLFFGAVFSGAGGGERAPIRVLVADLDGGPGARAFVARLGRSDALSVARAEPERARELVRRGKATAFLVIPKGWRGEPSFFRADAEDPPLRLGIDPSRRAEEGYLRGLILQAWFEGFRESFTQPERMRSEARAALARISADRDLSAESKAVLGDWFRALDRFLGRVDVLGTGGAADALDRSPFAGPKLAVERVARAAAGPPTAFAVTFPQAVVWALFGCLMGFAVSIVREIRDGTWLRLIVAPIRPLAVIAGKGLACLAAAVLVQSLLLAAGRAVFGVPWADPLLLAAAVLSAAFGFAGLMMLVAALGRSEQTVGAIGYAVMLVMAMLGGGMIPLIAMPRWLFEASDLSPVKWAIYSIEAASWRGLSWADTAPYLAGLVSMGAASALAGARLLARRTA